jgi:carbonic anhydrase/acetyltransferase-like protein (isoleucine patch superfamily)
MASRPHDPDGGQPSRFAASSRSACSCEYGVAQDWNRATVGSLRYAASPSPSAAVIGSISNRSVASGRLTVMATILPFDGVLPEIDPSAFIAPTATVIGRVRVAADAVVMFGAVLRADRDAISLGAGSNLQDNVVVHCDPGSPALVGAGVSVGHGAVVHGCTIGDDCLIGMNATVLNGAVIGEGSLVAGGAVVLEGTVVPPRSLVAGVPAKVRRTITDEEVDRIRTNAATYRELAGAYRAG